MSAEVFKVCLDKLWVKLRQEQGQLNAEVFNLINLKLNTIQIIRCLPNFIFYVCRCHCTCQNQGHPIKFRRIMSRN